MTYLSYLDTPKIRESIRNSVTAVLTLETFLIIFYDDNLLEVVITFLCVNVSNNG